MNDVTDRLRQLGFQLPTAAQACQGECEGSGIVPVHKHEREEPWRTLWEAQEALLPTPDGWHFVRCPECLGSGRR
jgi:hypothetical protein